MSASLVGSEMCIRDSVVPAWLGVRLGTAALSVQLGPRQSNARATTHPSSCLLYTSDAADDM
eukprot:8757580-Alexandrium_andersonii.AAC.1